MGSSGTGCDQYLIVEPGEEEKAREGFPTFRDFFDTINHNITIALHSINQEMAKNTQENKETTIVYNNVEHKNVLCALIKELLLTNEPVNSIHLNFWYDTEAKIEPHQSGRRGVVFFVIRTDKRVRTVDAGDISSIIQKVTIGEKHNED